jgi:hypothetical protein
MRTCRAPLPRASGGCWVCMAFPPPRARGVPRRWSGGLHVTGAQTFCVSPAPLARAGPERRQVEEVRDGFRASTGPGVQPDAPTGPRPQRPPSGNTVQTRVRRPVGYRAVWSIPSRRRATSRPEAIQRPSGGGPSRIHSPAPPAGRDALIVNGIAPSWTLQKGYHSSVIGMGVYPVSGRRAVQA